jgi:ABC-type transport system involved in multi-copper enzyme maturation permease subunit
MFPGPVCRFELASQLRRGRAHMARTGFGLFVLMLVWLNYYGWYAVNGGTLSPRQAVEFGQSTFASFAVGMLVAVLLLVPPLTAGVVAADRQRKTLHYLLMSRLTGPEIVLGRLGARLLVVGGMVMVGLPVLALLALLGGIDPRLVALAAGATASTAVFVGGASALISLRARRVRDAVFSAFALEQLWLVVPPVVALLAARSTSPIAPSVGAANAWLLATHPFAAVDYSALLAWLMLGSRAGAVPVDPEGTLWMIGLQTALGLGFALIAGARLRAVYRAEEGRARGWRAFWRAFRRPRRLLPRPPVGDDPVRWKECHTARVGGLAKAVGLLALVVLGGLIALWTARLGVPAAKEMIRYGYGKEAKFIQGDPGETRLVDRPGGARRVVFTRWPSPPTYTYQDRDNFSIFLRGVVPALATLWLVGLACLAAGSITSEREGDTWVSLTSTPLDGREVLLPKMLGALWGTRWPALGLLTLAVLGTATGSIHPVGLILTIACLLVFGWFAVALGMVLSLKLPTTFRAQFLTLAVLGLANVVGQTIFNAFRLSAAPMMPAAMPADVGRALLVVRQVAFLLANRPPRFTGAYSIEPTPWWSLILVVISLVLYAAGALALTRVALRSFDAAAGRPRRAASGARPAEAPEVAKLNA